jgi:hypothetical protein
MNRDPLLLLIVGFLLTGVAGGALTFAFQRRAWTHQHDVQRLDLDREAARKTYEELSTLLDRRLYRMRQVFVSARRIADQPGPSTALARDRDEYREVLRAWNDNLNRNLALVDTYFGAPARAYLETGLYEEFRAVGEELDLFIRDVSVEERGAVVVRRIAPRLNGLSHKVYLFNRVLLKALRDDRLGSRALTAAEVPKVEHAVVRFGDVGADVLRIQRALSDRGLLEVPPDGHFGPHTEAALLAAQALYGLTQDGVAGPGTRAALGLS